MQARLRETAERADLLAGRLTEPQAAAAPAAFESVRDWFYGRRNQDLGRFEVTRDPIGDTDAIDEFLVFFKRKPRLDKRNDIALRLLYSCMDILLTLRWLSVCVCPRDISCVPIMTCAYVE